MKTLPATPEALAAATATGRTAVLFHAHACPFCREFAPRFRRHVDGMPGLAAAEVVMDGASPLWGTLSIEVVPTMVLYQDGQVAGRRDGRLGVGLDDEDLAGLLGPRPA